MDFVKYQALGNDYLVVGAEAIGDRLTPAVVRRICDRHFGVGSDGILVQGPRDANDQFTLRIFNPDGSEAEKSGNGLRIFARALWDAGSVQDAPFPVITLGGLVTCQVVAQGQAVIVEMGQVRFTSDDIPVTGPSREVLQETLIVNGQAVEYSAATVGNPHCVIFRDHVSEIETRTLGPLIETAPHSRSALMCSFWKCVTGGISAWRYGNAEQGIPWPLGAVVVRRRQSLTN